MTEKTSNNTTNDQTAKTSDLSELDELDMTDQHDDAVSSDGTINDDDDFADDLDDELSDDEFDENDEGILDNAIDHLDSVQEEEALPAFYQTKKGKIAIGGAVGFIVLITASSFILFSSPKPAPQRPIAISQTDMQRPPQDDVEVIDDGFGEMAKPVKEPEPEPEVPLANLAPPTLSSTLEIPGEPPTISTPEITKIPPGQAPSIPAVGQFASADKLDEITQTVEQIETIVEGLEAQINRRDSGSEQALSAIRTRLRTLNSDVDALGNSVKSIELKQRSINTSLTEYAKQVEEVHASITDIQAANRNTSPNTSASLNEQLTGRQKLAGYKVLLVSPDANGEESIIFASIPDGSTDAYFVGKPITIGNESLVIEKIIPNKKTVLIGNKYYFNDIPEETPTPVMAGIPADDTVYAVSNTGMNVYGTVLSDWSLSAVFNKGFLLRMPSGEFLSVRKGQNVPQVGVVDGINEDGDLIVGDHKIRPGSVN